MSGRRDRRIAASPSSPVASNRPVEGSGTGCVDAENEAVCDSDWKLATHSKGVSSKSGWVISPVPLRPSCVALWKSMLSVSRLKANRPGRRNPAMPREIYSRSRRDSTRLERQRDGGTNPPLAATRTRTC